MQVSAQVLAEARALYAVIEEEECAIAKAFLGIAVETLPPYEEDLASSDL